ncbi:MAG TPA: heavy metal translocating P-type ATPase [Nitriliruptoraceae bacterium]|nr:heavy metal translocating P-type ATPase [Nitriliruptoraceae bacterium]
MSPSTDPHGDAVDGGHDDGGHDDGGHGDHADMFRRQFWRSLWLAVPILVTSRTVWGWFGVELPDAVFIDAVGPVLGTVLYLDGGRVFLTQGWQELRNRTPGMMALIAMAITVAFTASWASQLGWLELDEFWWELAGLIVIMLLGHWQEMRAIGQARSALDSLAALIPDTAELVDGDDTREVAVADLSRGDVVVVRPGSSVPADGVIAAGAAEFDESMLTGESTPVDHDTGDDVVAGSVALGSSVRVEVTATGGDTALAGIQRMVEEAQSSTSRTQVLADRAAAGLFWYATAAAVVTAVVWVALGNPGQAVARTVTVLVIACPHALGLAIPLVVSLATSMAARRGILVRDRMALEGMRQVDTVVFDKTGTLTEGAHRVTDMATRDGAERDDVLGLAAAAESDSEHPLARAIVAWAADQGVEVPQPSDFRSEAGKGVAATVDGRDVVVGGPAMLADLGLENDVADGVADAVAEWVGRGAAVLHVVVDGHVVAALALEDAVRDVSGAAVDELHDAGVRVVMATGDASQVADRVAGELGIDDVHAQVQPGDKHDLVAALHDDGAVVAMVGDGVNDAPALAAADVGIAIGAGTDVAAASAQIVLASDDPRNVAVVRRLSAATYQKMRQNLVWAAGYNVVAVPLAAGVLAPIGFVLPPAVGAILMSLSTIIVAANAQLLRRADIDGPHAERESRDDRASGPDDVREDRGDRVRA